MGPQQFLATRVQLSQVLNRSYQERGTPHQHSTNTPTLKDQEGREQGVEKSIVSKRRNRIALSE